MAHLAFITSLTPTRKPDTGFEIANAAIVAALREAGHRVTVAGFARPGDDLADDPDRVLLGRMVIENAQAPRALKARWLIEAVARGLPLSVAKLRLAGDVAERIAAAGPFDAVVLNSITMAGAFPRLLDLAPVLLIEHNIEFVSARQNAANAAQPLMRALFGREARLLEALERGLWERARFIWCLAEEDRAALPTDVQARSAVLPLVPATAAVTVAPNAVPRFDVGLIGTWTWEPNLIGLNWFLGEVAPHLPAGFKIGVAGRTPDGLTVQSGVAASIERLGRVPDADAFLADCRVLALASRAGTGVQLKTIEALARGWPAVATPLSLRGLGRPPANIVVADDGPGFARALIQHVEAVRDGRVTVGDGAAFIARQRAALSNAIAAGLVAAI
jgi:hypothetical protein